MLGSCWAYPDLVLASTRTDTNHKKRQSQGYNDTKLLDSSAVFSRIKMFPFTRFGGPERTRSDGVVTARQVFCYRENGPTLQE